MKALSKQEEAELLTKLLLLSERPPARTNTMGAGVVLGMTDVEIGVLVSKNFLKPLGKPALKASKWFATRELFRLAEDRDWLSKATQAIQGEWRERNSSRKAATSTANGEPTLS